MSALKDQIDFSKYPDIHKYSALEHIDLHTLVEAYQLEERYHKLLLDESDSKKRASLYDQFYSELIPLYGRDTVNIEAFNPKDKYVKLFSPELSGKSIVDFGCGQGHMLLAIKRLLKIKSLTGIDVSLPPELKNVEDISFSEANILTHTFDKPFDVAFSDNVLEHLVPEDAQEHLKNIHRNLNDNGLLIIIMPNRLFGPWDITRIKDFSQAGKTNAQGGHVNESTHAEMVENLKAVGFKSFQTIIPVPKLKYLLFNRIRIDAKWLMKLEQSKKLMKLLKLVRFRGVCLLSFPVMLIAKK